MAKHDEDNRSQQLNPEHDAYWQSRGEDERPDDWQDRLEHDDEDKISKTPLSKFNQRPLG